MNGITEHVLLCLEKNMGKSYVDWESIKELVLEMKNYDIEFGGAMKSLFKDIKKKQNNQLDIAHDIIKEKGNEIDFIAAKLQLNEEKIRALSDPNISTKKQGTRQIKVELNWNIKNDIVIEEGSDDNNEEDLEFFEFDHCNTTTNSHNGEVTNTNCQMKKIEENQDQIISDSRHEIYVYKTEILKLRKQLKQYLSLGLEWKRKYKDFVLKHKKSKEKHCAEIKKLYNMIDKLPSPPVTQKTD